MVDSNIHLIIFLLKFYASTFEEQMANMQQDNCIIYDLNTKTKINIIKSYHFYMQKLQIRQNEIKM